MEHKYLNLISLKSYFLILHRLFPHLWAKMHENDTRGGNKDAIQ